jgi:U5 snRNP spliceosome subunit
LKELRNSSTETGIWGNITDEDIEEAENEPPMMPGMGMPGMPPGMPGDPSQQQPGAQEPPPPDFLPGSQPPFLPGQTQTDEEFLPGQVAGTNKEDKAAGTNRDDYHIHIDNQWKEPDVKSEVYHLHTHDKLKKQS